MRVSTRVTYGIRAMIELAMSFEQGPVNLRTIAEKQGVSVKYLEQLFGRLRNSGLVLSKRGSKGGYKLAKRPEEIKLSEIFLCLEGPVVTVECVGDVLSCQRAGDCAWNCHSSRIGSVNVSWGNAPSNKSSSQGWVINLLDSVRGLEIQ